MTHRYSRKIRLLIFICALLATGAALTLVIWGQGAARATAMFFLGLTVLFVWDYHTSRSDQ